jgi:putative hydrolase of the HAD superfamily
MIKAVIFDFGGVVIRDTHEEVKDYIAENLGLERHLVSAIIKKTLPGYNTGTLSTSQYWKRFAELAGIPFPKDYDRLWRGGYESGNKLNLPLLDLVQALKKNGYMTPVLSNTISPHAEFNRSSHNFDPFDPVVLSYEVGMAKPDRRIYELMLARIKLRADECLFIDNTKENIDAAIDSGYHGIVYKGMEALRRGLKIHDVRF